MERPTEWETLQNLVSGETESIAAALKDGLKGGPKATADVLFDAAGRLNELYIRVNGFAQRPGRKNGRTRPTLAPSLVPPAPVS
ncbi:MAG: hypothetical protein U0514_02515 [Candidatus Andersenbacteria bacterium]